MKIVALYKTFSGKDWIEPSIKSIYPYVHKIVFVHSDISWTGIIGNRCREVVNKLKPFDKENKFIEINYNQIDQIRQCWKGYDYIRKNIKCDYVQLIDTDELWDDGNYKKAINFLENHPGQESYRTNIYTYVKSPYYRIDPPEGLKPVCFVRPDLSTLGDSARACALKSILMDNVYYHHYCLVRKTFNEVLEKIIFSHSSENQKYHQMNEWIPEVWNKIPDCKENFHMAVGYESNWKRIKIISLPEFPEILQFGDFDIMHPIWRQ